MKKILALLLFIGSSALFAQQRTHTVKAKETVYGISRQYGISQEELYKANPKIEKNGIHPGDLIVIPSTNATVNTNDNSKVIIDNSTKSNSEDDNYIYITIAPKETVYNIVKKYKVSEETLKSLNPQIGQKGLEVGDVVRVPKNNSNPAISIPQGSHIIKKGETLYSLSKT